MKTIKKTFLIILLLVTSISQVEFAQVDSSKIKYEIGTGKSRENTDYTRITIDSSKIIPGKNTSDIISDYPSMIEIMNLYYLAAVGKRDPSVVANELAVKADNAIPGLEEFLFNSFGQEKDTAKLNEVKSNMQLALFAVELINSRKAEQLLIKAAQLHPEKEVRGVAANILAVSHFNKANNDSTMSPDKEILHALIQCARDTSYSRTCEDRVNKIAQKGIQAWTGAFIKNSQNTGKQSTSPDTYNEQWWLSNKDKILWDKNNKKFFVN